MDNHSVKGSNLPLILYSSVYCMYVCFLQMIAQMVVAIIVAVISVFHLIVAGYTLSKLSERIVSQFRYITYRNDAYRHHNYSSVWQPGGAMDTYYQVIYFI